MLYVNSTKKWEGHVPANTTRRLFEMKRGKKYIEADKTDRKRKSLRESRSSCISEKISSS
mgnify:CR=1 FL=1